jgi:tetratricopeptide (TPR) repeat protein
VWFSRVTGFAAVLVLLTGCATTGTIMQAEPVNDVWGVGYSESTDENAAKANAAAQARNMAAIQMAYDNIPFTFVRYGDNDSLTVSLPDGVEAGEVAKVEKLDARKVRVTAHAKRPAEVVNILAKRQVIQVRDRCAKGTYDRRLKMALHKTLNTAAEAWVESKYGRADGTYKGKISIVSMKVEEVDIGVEVEAQVAFNVSSKKKLSDADKGVALFATWRKAAMRKEGHIEDFVEIFKKAGKLAKQPSMYYDFGQYMIARNDLKQAQWAYELAVKMAPKNVEYLESLRRVYMAQNMDDKAAELDERIDNIAAVEGDVQEWSSDESVRSSKIVLEKKKDDEKDGKKEKPKMLPDEGAAATEKASKNQGYDAEVKE